MSGEARREPPVSGARGVPSFPPVPRPDMATAADVAAQLRALFPDVNAASYRCVCDTCGEPWADCIGMACADCPTYCATCAAERAEACRDCGDSAYELIADGLCGPCLSVALADRQADRDYEQEAGK